MLKSYSNLNISQLTDNSTRSTWVFTSVDSHS